MSDLSQVKERIRQAIADAENPAVLVSFGKDSLLLLFFTLQIKPDVAIIWFKQRANVAQRRFAERIIQEWDLVVLSYAPATSYLLPNDEGLTLVDEHSFGGTTLPLLTDAKDGTECAIHLQGEQTPFFSYPFDVTLYGYKASDTHSLLSSPLPDEIGLSSTRLLAPLWDLTDAEVLRAIEDLAIPYEAIDDSISVCTKCLTARAPVFCPEAQTFIPPVMWQPNERLAEFRQRFL